MDNSSEPIPEIGAAVNKMPEFTLVRRRWTEKLLRDIDITTATGPDLLPARVLQRCHFELSFPVTLLARLIVNTGKWPNVWRRHWLHPLHKRLSKAYATHYRAVHITSLVSKIIERLVKMCIDTFLTNRYSFGIS